VPPKSGDFSRFFISLDFSEFLMYIEIPAKLQLKVNAPRIKFFWRYSMYRTVILSVVSLLCLTTSARASIIYVSGDQTGIWSADTVIVTAGVRVPPGQSLTILPGVEVLFSAYCKLNVANGATLQAIGTAVDSIRFDVLPPNVNWHGIRFISASDSSRLEYCFMTQGSASGSGADDHGGVIYCSSSNPTISHNTIMGNSAGWGGAIACSASSPVISSNTINRNSASGGGGIYCSDNSNPSISCNTISENSATNLDGGGIYCTDNSNANIQSNVISENAANTWWGGGIIVYDSNPNISGNLFSQNSASDGGGLFITGFGSSIVANTFSGNTATYSGGGIYCYSSTGSAIIRGNTFSGNTAYGSGIYCYNNPGGIVNCILWGNSGEPIRWYISPPDISYSNVQGFGTWGTNIDTDPLFINADQGDYRLQWDSPCIDTGDPNPLYNDPDSTRSDMGAWYYDQSMPMRILLTPYSVPIQIPASGGSFDFAIQATNIDTSTLPVQVWCDVTLPSGTIYGPVLNPVTISLASGQTISRVRTQAVPAGAPAGIYHYNGYAVAGEDTSEDSFVFAKLGGGDGNAGTGGWMNTGEAFGIAVAGAKHASPLQPEAFGISVSPNPFNPTTIISYQLSADSFVTLRVYNMAGRLVAELVDGWREAGSHAVTFDGSGLPSGIYIYRLQVGDIQASEKMALIK
jgi:parallel beta-helix repeat protein/predicted outer membrane repeat protein